MAAKQGRSQKSRTQKTSKGVNRGSRRERPSELLLISMGKGMAHQTRRRR